jgi:hypothetical protein
MNRLRIADCGLGIKRRAAALRAPLVVHSAIRIPQSAFSSRRRSASALTLIEILIAMFIFLVGCLGVLSVFPVAMKNAGDVLGEMRANTLAQSVVGQTTADCRVNFELPTTGPAQANTNPPLTPNTFVRLTAATIPKNEYFVTMLDGPGRGQSRFIASGDTGSATVPMNVSPPWTAVNIATLNPLNPQQLSPPVWQWTGPGSLGAATSVPYFPNEHYCITRMGLPERPLVAGDPILQGQGAIAPPATPYYVYSAQAANYTYGSFGLNRDLAVRSFVSGNGFNAGIANPGNTPNGTIQVDPLVAYCGMAGVSAANNLNGATFMPWNWPINPQLSNNYQVRIVGGTGAGQVRTITGNTNTQLIVAPNWVIVPDSTSVYEFGWANTIPGNVAAGAQNATWCAQLYPIPPPLVTPAAGAPGNVVGNGGKWLTDNSGKATWTVNQYQGKYVTTGAGQARAIVSNTGGAADNSVNPPTPPYTLVVTPAFTVSGSQNYIITESYGYVLITSGRASNRLFPIAWDQIDNTNGHLIVCAGTDFQALTGITAAQRPNSNAGIFPGGYSYNLQDGTTFTVIGNYSALTLTWPLGGTVPYPSMPLILNAVPDGTPINSTLWPWTAPPPNPCCPPWFNTMNTVGDLNSFSQPNRLAQDQYNVLQQAGGVYTSEYTYGVIFSDSGTDPNLPVRVDVLVWRNFDTTKDFVENQKPVGHMTGYIKRP